MKAKLGQFLSHFESRDTQPAGGFGLVALSQSDGLGKKFRLKVGHHFGVSVMFLATLHAGKQLGNVGRMGLTLNGQGFMGFGQNLPYMLQADGEGSREKQRLTNDIFQLPDVAWPRLTLQK